MSGGFLSRWARLKAESQAADTPPAPAPLPDAPAAAPPAVAGEATAADTAPTEGEEPFDLDSLPAVDSLTAESDYSVFMDARVPGDLRARALRKLWASDPVFAVRDGLLDYDEDFGAASRTGQVVTSAWDALTGYAAQEEAGEDGGEDAPASTASPSPQVAVEETQERHTEEDGIMVRDGENPERLQDHAGHDLNSREP